ncbi:MAG: MT-A70 family methyltransferase [Pseudomonadota bacterium]
MSLDLPLLHYGLIIADPPWHFQTRSGEPSVPYKTMSVEEICCLQVGHLASKDCALLLWSASPNLLDALKVMSAWNFQFKGKAFCWAKTNPRQFHGPASASKTWFMGRGYGSRSNTEDCWLGTVGSPTRLSAAVRELIVAPVREHSRKPDEAYERAEKLFAGPYLDLFSRQSRPGWDTWGNEAGKFDAA